MSDAARIRRRVPIAMEDDGERGRAGPERAAGAESLPFSKNSPCRTTAIALSTIGSGNKIEWVVSVEQSPLSCCPCTAQKLNPASNAPLLESA